MSVPASGTQPADKSLVMILGAARSGTTMLDLMLGNADDVFSCGEVWGLFRPHRLHHFSPRCLCGDPECAVWKRLATVEESEFHAAALAQDGINFVIDSSKDLRWLLDSHKWAAASGFKIYNIIIWKDPMSLSYSHWKRGRPVDFYRKAFVRYYGRFLNLGLPFISVSYNRVIEDSVQVLRELCDALGMQYESGREEFWRKRHHHMFGSAGTARQVNSGKSELKLITDYPDEFVQAFEAHTHAAGLDQELDQIISGLTAHELGGRQNAADGREVSMSALKPAWYYYHHLKALFRRYFPETGAIAD
jgi:hypothetical protein